MLGLAQANEVSQVKMKPENRSKAPRVCRQGRGKNPEAARRNHGSQENQPCGPWSWSYPTPELKETNPSLQTLKLWSRLFVLWQPSAKVKQAPILILLGGMKNASTILENGLVIS